MNNESHLQGNFNLYITKFIVQEGTKKQSVYNS